MHESSWIRRHIANSGGKSLIAMDGGANNAAVRRISTSITSAQGVIWGRIPSTTWSRCAWNVIRQDIRQEDIKCATASNVAAEPSAKIEPDANARRELNESLFRQRERREQQLAFDKRSRITETRTTGLYWLREFTRSYLS